MVFSIRMGNFKACPVLLFFILVICKQLKCSRLTFTPYENEAKKHTDTVSGKYTSGNSLMHSDSKGTESGSNVSRQENAGVFSQVNWRELTGGRDRYMCGPCSCSNTSKGEIKVDCSSIQLKHIPAGLPKNIYMLNMSENSLQTFETTSILQFSSISSVLMSSNSQLHEVKLGGPVNKSSPAIELDLSVCNISHIEARSFLPMPFLRNLTLSHNKLHTISNLTFEGLLHLRDLDLSNNDIRILQVGAFDNLERLRSLNLIQNVHLGYSEKRLSPNLFLHLENLQSIYLQGSSNGHLDYPNAAFGQMKNLRILGIDALHNEAVLGDESKALKQLTSLEMGTKGGFCRLTRVNSSFFKHMPKLQSFKLENCKLGSIEHNAYQSLKTSKVNTLSLMNLTRYDLYTALEDMEFLQNSTLKTLRLIQLYYTHCPCRQLQGAHAKYLKNIELELLDLSFNRLAAVSESFIKALPSTLKTFVLRFNTFTLAQFISNKLVPMKGLIELDVSGQSVNLFSKFPIDSVADTDMASENSTSPLASYCQLEDTLDTGRRNQLDEDSLLYEASVVTHGKSMVSKNQDKDASSQCDLIQIFRQLKSKFQMPPNLRVLKAESFNSFGTIIFSANLNHNNSLKAMDLSRSFMVHWGPGRMPLGVEEVDLSNNFCTAIDEDFFQQNNSLVHLNLRNNFLGDQFALDNGSLFAKLDKLKYLDISSNRIFRFQSNFFMGLKNIQDLVISENKVMYVNSTLSHMSQLRYLDLSKNAISHISKHVLDDLDTIASNSRYPLKVDLSLNPLPCMCDDLDLLYWMANTNVHLLNSDFISCRFDDGIIDDVGDLQERLRSLQRYCASKGIIICICVACLVVCMVIVSFALMYRYRWKLRYLRNIALAKLIGFEPRIADGSSYKFDAYFLYTEESRKFVLRDCVRELEVKRGHRLCLEDRDFMPGTMVVSGIVGAVQNSSKTIPVVTPDFYDEDYHSEYCIKMALMEENYKKRSILYLCVYQPMTGEQMKKCRDLLMVLERQDYIEYPPQDETCEQVRENFWDQLSQAIGHSCGDPNTSGFEDSAGYDDVLIGT